MKAIFMTFFLLLADNVFSLAQNQSGVERKQLFDYNWKFRHQPNQGILMIWHGIIAGVDHADIKDYDQYTGNSRKAWHGRALLVIKSTHNPGDIKLTVTSTDLSEAILNIKTFKR